MPGRITPSHGRSDARLVFAAIKAMSAKERTKLFESFGGTNKQSQGPLELVELIEKLSDTEKRALVKLMEERGSAFLVIVDGRLAAIDKQMDLISMALKSVQVKSQITEARMSLAHDTIRQLLEEY